jgi:hypothetical protein
MCNPLLLKVFISACLFFNQNNMHALGINKCVKAYDICVERQIRSLDSYIITGAQYDKALDMCDDDIFNRRVFSEYYTDDICGWSEE